MQVYIDMYWRTYSYAAENMKYNFLVKKIFELDGTKSTTTYM